MKKSLGAPSEAENLARHDLKVLHDQINDVLQLGTLDEMSRIHLEGMVDRIEDALKAKAIIQIK